MQMQFDIPYEIFKKISSLLTHLSTCDILAYMKLQFIRFLPWLVLLIVSFACVRQGSLPMDENLILTPITSSETPTLKPTQTNTPQPTPTPVPAIRIEAGERALMNGDWHSALEEYTIALEVSNAPELQSAALLGIGKARLLERNYYEVDLTLEGLLQLFPDSTEAAEAYFALGQSYNAQEKYLEAADAYLEYLIRRPGVIDSYVLDIRGDTLFAANDYVGAANDYLAALESPSLLDQVQLKLKLARAYALSGDYTSAISLYDELYKQAGSDYTSALIDLRRGQAYEALGQLEQAYQSYQDAVDQYPTSYDAYSALVALVEAGIEVDQLQRGIVNYYAAQYGLALTAFDRYLQEVPTDSIKAYYFYGLTLRAIGDSVQAINYWDKVIQGDSTHLFWDDAWEQKAYTQWAFLEDFDSAIQTLLDFVDKASGHPRAAEFLFEAALIAEKAENLEEAADLFQRVNSNYPNYERSTQSLFLTGITKYRLGNYPDALITFQHYLSLVTTLEDRAAANLWIGKSQKELGDLESATASWETAASIDPTGYYSERARDILHDLEPFSPPQDYDLGYDLQREREEAENWLRTTFAISTDTDLSTLGELANDQRIQRGIELWRLGLFDSARSEFEQFRLYVATDPADSYRLTNFLVDLGCYRIAILTARQVLDLALMDDVGTLSAPVYFNHIRFGSYFGESIIPLANEYGFHPLFIFSLVRQESLFDPHISSSAGARGLMQIMPTTGADIQKNLGFPDNYSVEDLLRPDVNVLFGIDYLDTQRDYFDDNIYAALAAYNSGPGNAAIWLKAAPEDFDLFLEVVRFVETRNYIRGVYELFNLYRVIYNRTP